MNHSIRTPFGKAKIYSVGTTSSKEHAMVIPGFSETLAHSRSLVDALARQGFDAFTFSQPRKRGKRSVDPIQRQGEIVLRLVDSEIPKDKKVHAVAHSLGSAAVLKAARQAPERFASITLMQPIGLVGDQSFAELAGRANKKVMKNQLGALRRQDPARQPRHGYRASVDTESAARYSGRVAHAQLAGGVVLAKQPALSLDEASTSGKYEYIFSDDLRKVSDLGIPIHIIKAQSDEMFDQDKVDIGYAAIADSISSYSSVADVRARHDTSWMQPERSARIVSQLVHQS